MVSETIKKRRLEQESKRSAAQPRIFHPFRAVGYVTNDVPATFEARGQDFFMTTCVGKNFQIYNLKQMNLLFVGPQAAAPLTALATLNDITFAACGNQVIIYKRAKEIARIVGEAEFAIVQLVVFGSHILGLCDDNILRMWDYKTQELYTQVEFDETFTASAILHPSTYLNKVLVSSNQGTMQIWNMRTNQMIYSFKSFGSPITSLTQSPVVDVVAIGLLDGTTILHNIKMDEKIDNVRQDERVTAVSFRTDGQHIMATANMQGDIALWDLEKRSLVHVMKGAHDGNITSIQFLNSQPILVTCGSDNAVKQWIFDNLDGTPRLLKSRSGHHSPPSKIRYYGHDGHFILSSGRDRSLRAFSTVRDAQTVELSQGSLAKKAKNYNLKIDELKLPQITQFAASERKQKEWDNILTCHLNDNGARTWSYKNKVLGKHVMQTKDTSAVKAVAISSCGNFGFVGSGNGAIDMFNMQSGIYRKTFHGESGHKKAITGIVGDNLNRYLITSSVDKTVKLWDFNSAKLLHTITLESPIVSIEFQRDSDLLAVACDDLGIRVVDIETQKVVREFWGHRNRITDMTFSSDGRWIVSASLDATVRTWDLPTGNLVDIFKVDDVATSVTFSPTGDFLATTHVDNVGIFLWANKTQFGSVSLRSITDDEVAELISLPTSSGLEEGVEISNDAGEQDDDQVDGKTEQLTEDMITLSLLPRSKWQNLLNLETIKLRNKSKEAPKTPEKAPFFLPTLPGVVSKFAALEKTNEAEDEDKRFRGGFSSDYQSETEFTRLLRAGHEEGGNYTAFISYLKTLNPSGIDFEIRSMSLDSELTLLNYYLEAMEYQLKTRRDFELVQAWLSAFLNVHGDIIVANPGSITDRLQHILQSHQQEFTRLSEQIHYGLCLIDFLRKA
ncbi:hypothetical protein INT43_003998 [Umbelopsis isabellina]|uniref:Utp21-domain-containing protein n=1 Tax=Mortierella isabellina TaxID=91625 RepID=A0A8H7PTD7_MORIS|nr:hypothetical protein INT43_003998 [Umbelopsis isabellina]